MITKLDFVGVPSTDAERSREFYVETLGLRPDDNGRLRILGRRDLLRHLGAGEDGHASSRPRRMPIRPCTSTTSPPPAPSSRRRASSS